jgi:hypothetical protein
MNEANISQKVQTSLATLFKDRYDLLIDVLVKHYPNTFEKIIEQSVALQVKTPVSIFDQLQTGFEKGGMFGLIGTVAKKLFKKTDVTNNSGDGLTDYLKDEVPEVSYTNDTVNLKTEQPAPVTSTEQIQDNIQQRGNVKPKDYFDETIEPIPFKFDGFTDNGEIALWNVFPPLFKDIFKDILGTPVEEEKEKPTGPMSSFEEKGLFGSLLDFFTGGDGVGAKDVKNAGGLLKRAATAVGGGISSLAKGAVTLAKTPVSAAATGKAGAAGLLGTAGAVVGGEVIGGQIGKAIGSNEKFSEYWYGDKKAAKEAYETYGTGITGFLRASWDYGKQLIETNKSKKQLQAAEQKGIERLKSLDEPAKRKLSVQFEKGIEESIQRIEKIKSDTSFTAEEKMTQIQSIEENIFYLKQQLKAVQTPSPEQKPPTTPLKDTESTKPPIKPSAEINSAQQNNNENPPLEVSTSEKQMFKDLHDSDFDVNSTTDNKKIKQLKDAVQQVGTNDISKLQTTVYNIQYGKSNSSTNKNNSNVNKPNSSSPKLSKDSTSKTESTLKDKTDSLTDFKESLGKTSAWTPEMDKEAEDISQKIQTSTDSISDYWSKVALKRKEEKEANIVTPTKTEPVLKQDNASGPDSPPTLKLKENEQTPERFIDTSSAVKPSTQVSLLPQQPVSQITPSLIPTLEKESNITPIEVQMPDNLQNLNIPDNADILNNIASNTDLTNNTLKNLNGAILKLAQVFNDKMDKPGSNNYFVNGQQQQNQTYPSASQVAASNYNPISRVRLQFGLG